MEQQQLEEQNSVRLSEPRNCKSEQPVQTIELVAKQLPETVAVESIQKPDEVIKPVSEPAVIEDAMKARMEETQVVATAVVPPANESTMRPYREVCAITSLIAPLQVARL